MGWLDFLVWGFVDVVLFFCFFMLGFLDVWILKTVQSVNYNTFTKNCTTWYTWILDFGIRGFGDFWIWGFGFLDFRNWAVECLVAWSSRFLEFENCTRF